MLGSSGSSKRGLRCLSSPMERVIRIGPVFKNPTSCIVNSRQGKYPTRQDLWVKNTIEAVSFSISKGEVLLTSTGIKTYELTLYLCGAIGGKQIVVLPLKPSEDPQDKARQIINDFNLNENLTSFAFFQAKPDEFKRKTVWHKRDRIILENADVIYPVSIRNGGFMQSVLKKFASKIVDDFQIPYTKSIWFPPPPPQNCLIKSENWNFLTHWTRTFPSPYPDEKPSDYYNSIIETEIGYSHSAFRTLIRMLEKKKIFGSSENIKGKHSVVSFTELPPSESLEVMRWHRGKGRFTFEPYGIAVEKSELVNLGAEKVIYGPKNLHQKLPDDKKWLFQYEGENGEWKKEKEWRIKEEVDISKLNPDKLRIIVRNSNEARTIEKTFGFKTLFFEE